jgi:hypothetical protein
MLSLNKFFVLLVSASCCIAGKGHDWQTGTVLDSESGRTYLQTRATTTATAYGSTATANTRIDHTAIQNTQLWIVGKSIPTSLTTAFKRLSGFRRTVSSPDQLRTGSEDARFVVGDEIKYSQEKSKLFAIDADGRECKLDIVRQERLQH